MCIQIVGESPMIENTQVMLLGGHQLPFLKEVWLIPYSGQRLVDLVVNKFR
jgi:hypothetical protein